MLLVDDSPAGSCSTCPGSTLVSVTALHLILFPVEACCESGDDWGTVTKPKDDKRFIFSRAGRDRYYRRANVAPQVLARVKQKTRSPLSNTTTYRRKNRKHWAKTYVRDMRRSDQTTPSFSGQGGFPGNAGNN